MKKTLIERIEVGSGGAASILLDAIPQTYTDLYLVISIRNNRSAAAAEEKIYFNGNTSNFSTRYLEGSGAAAATGVISGRGFAGVEVGNTSTANTFSSTAIYIPNYTSGNAKSFSSDSVQENNATASAQYLVAGRWSDTAAITSITIDSGFTLLEYCSASLYGVTAGNDGTTTVS